MSEPVSADTAEHYNWSDITRGGICDGWHLVRNEALSVIEERMPPSTSEQRHWHRNARQFFYVLEGELTMAFDDRTVVLTARQGIEIAPGVPHQAKNTSGADVRFLVISQPPGQGDRQTA